MRKEQKQDRLASKGRGCMDSLLASTLRIHWAVTLAASNNQPGLQQAQVGKRCFGALRAASGNALLQPPSGCRLNRC